LCRQPLVTAHLLRSAVMNLPVTSPLKPMLAKRADALPDGDDWLYEPKWDGVRVLVFRDGDDWLLQSRDLKPLGRCFPELARPVLDQLPSRCVVDGEVVVAGADGLDFETLSQRIHPAKSRIARLAEETPAALVLWDLLCLGDDDLRAQPFEQRRQRLEQVLADARPPLHLTPATRDRDTGADWFARFEGAGLDGVMAKRLSEPYQPGKRTMLKIKHQRTADCVIAGFRWHKNGPGTMLGSLLLGLYDDAGTLHHVGVAASFTAKRRHQLVEELAPLRDGASAGHPWLPPDNDNDNGNDNDNDNSDSDGDGSRDRAGADQTRRPGSLSRWSKGKNLNWEPLRPERVVEVKYDHLEGDRFRHTAHFVRWRPDKPPAECTYAQLEVTPPYELAQIFTAPTTVER
ncbi:MAG: ATP-dependent DNA ligase, partial [Myxococcota bacterium]